MSLDGRKRNTYSIFDREQTDGGKWEEHIDSKIDVKWFIDSLPEPLQRVTKYLRDGYTQRQIAEKMGYSHQTVSKYVKKIRRLGREFFS